MNSTKFRCGLLLCVICTFCQFSLQAAIKQVSFLPLPGIARDVAIQGNIAIVSTDSAVAAVDISNPRTPVLRSVVKVAGAGRELSVVGNYAFVAGSRDVGLLIVDISKPESLHIAGSGPDSCGYVWGIDSRNTDNSSVSEIALASLSGFTLIDAGVNGTVSTISRFHPYRLNRVPDNWVVECDSCWGRNRWIKTDDVIFDSCFVYVLYYDPISTISPGVFGFDQEIQLLKLKKVDITDKYHPRCVDSLTLHNYGCALDVADGYTYVVYAGRDSLDFKPGMDIIDVSSTAMVLKSNTTLPGAGEDIAVRGDRAYIACEREGVFVYTIADPMHPSLVDSFSYGLFSFPISANGIAIKDSLFCIAAGERGIQILRNELDPLHSNGYRPPSQNLSMISSLDHTILQIQFSERISGNAAVEIYTASGALFFKGESAIKNSAMTVFKLAGRGIKTSSTGVFIIKVKVKAGTAFQRQTTAIMLH